MARLRDAAAAGDPWDRGSPLHATGSALVVHPPSRQVLLRWHARQRAWLQVGGHADPGETDPLAVALREAREETGLTDLTPWPDAAPLHVVVVPVAASGDESEHAHADIRFALATTDPDAVQAETPGAAVCWLPLGTALATTTEANLHESLTRLAARFVAS